MRQPPLHRRQLTSPARRLGSGMLLGLALCGTAAAHPQFALSTVNRYAKLVLGGPGQSRSGRLFYTLMVGDAPASRLRRQADRDGSGQLEASEQQQLAADLAKLVATAVALTLDGQPLTPDWEPPLLSLPDPGTGPTAFSCELGARLPLPLSDGRAHELRYDDRVTEGPIGEVELRIEEGPGATVTAAWQGVRPTTATPRSLTFLTSGPPLSSLSDRSVSLRFGSEVPPPATRHTSGSSRWPGRWLLGLLLLLGVGIATTLGFRRRSGP